jgi:predicted MFS family arabinose efflux permease
MNTANSEHSLAEMQDLDSPPAPENTDNSPSLLAHLAVFCAAMGGFMALYCTQAIYPALKSLYGISVAQAGALLTATTLGLALAAPFAGAVTKKWGARPAVIGGILALASTALMLAFVHSANQLFAVRLLQGLLIPVVLSAMLASMGSLWSGRHALSISATYVTGTVLGGIVGRFLPGFLFPFAGWTGSFVAFAVLQAALVPAVYFFYPRVSQALSDRATHTNSSQFWRSVRASLGATSIAGFLLLFTQAAITTYIAIRFSSAPYEWSTGSLGLLYAVFLPALIFVRLTPKFVSRFGSSKSLLGAAILAWVGLTLTAFSAPSIIITGMVIFAISVFVCQTVLAHLVGAAKTGNKEVGAGVYLCCYYLGGSVGALAPALLWDRWRWHGCLLLVAGVQLAAGVAFLISHQKGKNRTDV